MVRDLVSMAAAATEKCLVWSKTAAQDVKCVQAHCCGAGFSRHPAIFPVFSAKLFTQMSQDLHVEFLVNCLLIRSILMVYETLRTKKRQ